MIIIDSIESIVTALLFIWVIGKKEDLEEQNVLYKRAGFIAAYLLIGLAIPALNQTGALFAVTWGLQLLIIAGYVYSVEKAELLEVIYKSVLVYVPTLFGSGLLNILLVLFPHFDPTGIEGYLLLVMGNLLCKFLSLYLIKKSVNIRNVKTYLGPRLFIAISLFLLWGVMRYIMEVFPMINKEFVLLLLVNYVLIISVFIMTSRMFSFQAEAEEAKRIAALNEMRYQSEKNSAILSKDIRRLKHDLNNIMLGLQTMTAENEVLEEYVSSIKDNYQNKDIAVIETGNSSLDGLLTSKWQIAKHKNIDLSVCVDFSTAEFIKPIDIFTVFGNALDNAIEAADKAEEDNRIIRMRSRNIQNMLIVKIENGYNGIVNKENGLLVTTKSNADLHGIGIASMKESLNKYNGEITCAEDPENKIFRLTIMIPMVNNP